MNPNPEMAHPDAAAHLHLRLRADLVAAMKARQAETVALLRTLIAAIDNAQAVATIDLPIQSTGTHIAGAQSGVGSTEVARRVLSAADVRVLLQEQVDERDAAVEHYDTHGATDAAARLRREAGMVRQYIEALGTAPQS